MIRFRGVNLLESLTDRILNLRLAHTRETKQRQKQYQFPVWLCKNGTKSLSQQDQPFLRRKAKFCLFAVTKKLRADFNLLHKKLEAKLKATSLASNTRGQAKLGCFKQSCSTLSATDAHGYNTILLIGSPKLSQDQTCLT